MTEKSVDLFDSNFKLSHLTSKPTSHQIKNLKPFDKNLELRVIVISKKDNFVTKNQAEYYEGDSMSPGDILYINNAYTSLFKGQLILYEGKGGVVFKIGEFFFHFVEEPNVSILDWSEYSKAGGQGFD